MRFFRFIFVVALVFALCFGAGVGLAGWLKPEVSPPLTEADEGEVVVDEKPGQRTSILILGLDEREGETNSRSDTIILLTIDPSLKKAAVISIPRDTRVTMQNGGENKINAVYALGGPKASVQAVQKLLEIPVDYYMELNFKAFTKVVDALGGVTINVPERMYKPSEDIDLYAGLQRLDGHDALAFVRWRDYLLGDIDRTSKQQEFLVALANEALQPSTIPKLPRLIKETRSYLKTDMGLGQMLKMATWAPGFSASAVVSQTLPGYFYDQLDAHGQLLQSYWVADKNTVAGLVDKMLSGQTVAVVQEESVIVRPPAPKKSVVESNPEPEDDFNPKATPKASPKSVRYTDSTVSPEIEAPSDDIVPQTGLLDTSNMSTTSGTGSDRGFFDHGNGYSEAKPGASSDANG